MGAANCPGVADLLAGRSINAANLAADGGLAKLSSAKLEIWEEVCFSLLCGVFFEGDKLHLFKPRELDTSRENSAARLSSAGLRGI